MRTQFRFRDSISAVPATVLALFYACTSATALAEPPRSGANAGADRPGAASTIPHVAEVVEVTDIADLSCPAGMILGTGAPDQDLLSEEASVGVRAFWCERYDAFGNASRIGPYREVYANGRIRLEAMYVKVGQTTRLEGPVAIRNDDGSPFLRGFLKAGEWAGDLVIFHEAGQPWFEGKFEQGRLNGPLRTHHADGALESETRFSGGREQGLARSFFATASGGRLKSEVRVESGQIVGAHRLLDPKGKLRRKTDSKTYRSNRQAGGVPRKAPKPETPKDATQARGLDDVWPIGGTAAPVGPAAASPASVSRIAPGSAPEELDASN